MPTASQPADEARTDVELVRRAQRGEPGAYDALFERYYPRVFNFALKMDGNRENAADIAQTAFVRAYESLPRLRDGQAFLGWLYRIVVNLVRDRAKSARRKPWVSFLDLWPKSPEEEAEPLEFSDPSQDPERLTAMSERQRALAAAIVALPLEFREALVLHHLQDMGLNEVSMATGVPVGTVKSRLGRARQRLRAALGDWIEGGEGA